MSTWTLVAALTLSGLTLHECVDLLPAAGPGAACVEEADHPRRTWAELTRQLERAAWATRCCYT